MWRKKLSILVLFVLIFVGFVDILPYSSSKQIAWNDSLTLNNNGNHPSIAVSENNVHIVWDDSSETPSGEIYYMRSTDGGNTWASKVMLSSNDGKWGDSPDIAVHRNKIFVVWSDYSDGDPEIFIRVSTDNGANWGDVNRVTSSPSGFDCMYPTIAVSDNGNKLVVVFFDDEGSEIYFSYGSGDGTFSGNYYLLSWDDGEYSHWPDITSQGSTFYVVWSDRKDEPNNRNEIYFAKSSGWSSTMFTTKERLTPIDAEHSMRPTITAISDNVYVTWYDEQYSPEQVMFRRSIDRGETWDNPQVISSASNNCAQRPQIDTTSQLIVNTWTELGKIKGVFSFDEGETWVQSFSMDVGSSPVVYVGANNYTAHITWRDNNGIHYINSYLNSPPNSPYLTSPDSNIWTSNNTPTFSWTFIDENIDHTQSAFNLQLDDNNDFSSIEYEFNETSANNIYTPTTPISDDLYYWHIKTKDEYEWGEFSESRVIGIDTTAPESPMEITITPDDWTNINSFTIDWTDPPEDTTSGIKTGAWCYIGFSEPIQFNGAWSDEKPITIDNAPEGESNIYVWLEDNVGNKNYTNNAPGVLKLDTIEPDDVSLVIEGNVQYTTSKTVSLGISATDPPPGSGLNKMRISETDTFSYAGWQDFSISTTFELSDGDGKKTIYLEVNDIAGNLADIVSDSIMLDTIAPTIDEFSPGDGATDISINTFINITFSELMNQTLTEDAISIEPEVDFETSWDGSKLQICPNFYFENDTIYEITVDRVMQDIAGNGLQSALTWSFTTEKSPTNPDIIDNEPIGEDISVDTKVSLTFNKKMDEDSVEYAFSMTPHVDGLFSWDNNKIIFNPDSNLDYETEYTVSIGISAIDINGNNLNEPFEWTFTTKKIPIDKPVVTDKTPVGLRVQRNTEITITFNKEMNKDSVKDAFTISPYVPGTTRWEGNTFIYTPQIGLKSGNTYQISFDDTVEDIGGNELTDFEGWSFTTVLSTDVDDEEPKSGISLFLIAIIIGLFLIFGGVVAFLLIRKKRKSKTEGVIAKDYGEWGDRDPTDEGDLSDQSFSEAEIGEYMEPPDESQDGLSFGSEKYASVGTTSDFSSGIEQLQEEEKPPSTFVVYESVTCGICLGHIKTGGLAYQCSCNKIYHPTCINRIGECPSCHHTITDEEVGIPDDKIRIEQITIETPSASSIRWGADPQIVGGDESFKLRDLFLIYTDGRLIKSLVFETKMREEMDEDIMSGMLTAITDFIKDSFSEESGALKSLQYGKMTIYIERGVTIYLVVVFTGTPPEDLRKRMRTTLIRAWEKYKTYLKVWDGSLDGLENIDDDLIEHLGVEENSAVEDDEYEPPKYTGEILTAEVEESVLPNIVTTADVSKQQGCYHLYNMLLAKKGSDIRIGPESESSEISKARKKIITLYHPDKWPIEYKEKATFFMQKVNVAWEVLSRK